MNMIRLKATIAPYIP